ncbi:MAG: hypothetical protein WCB68_09545 [Pyrinomonadaceae bacterium]
MFGSSILEVAIGMIFVYLLLSLMCSAFNEIIESFLKKRATDLESGIRELFNQSSGGQLVSKFYQHPMISGLFQGTYKGDSSEKAGLLDRLKTTNLPSYIPARNFAYAVLDIALHPPAEGEVVRDDSGAKPGGAAPVNASAFPASMEAVRLAIRRNLGDTEVGRALRTLAEQSGDDLNLMRQNIESWFNSSMDRVSGIYKRRTQRIIFVLGFILTVLLNVNSITIAQRFYSDPTLRAMVVAEAGTFTKNPDAQKPDFKADREQLEKLGLPIGWPPGFDFLPKPFDPWNHLFIPLIGWLLTALAISLGAPFWFDLLNKFMVIRATVKPHEKSLEEGSEDRQQNANLLTLAATGTLGARTSDAGAAGTGQGVAATTEPEVLSIPEPDFAAAPDPPDNESHIDEGDEPILEVTPDEELPPTQGGVA